MPGGYSTGPIPAVFDFARAALFAVVGGTGPTYTGRFRTSDSENLRNVKQGDVIVVTDTDINRFVARGSDRSRVTLMERHHFTVNTNSDVTVEFHKVRVVGCEGISESD